MWAARCFAESQLHERNSFLTLTYEDSQLPPHESLVPKHLSDFIKRLREDLRRDYGVLIRHFSCGEYGDDKERPHYHAAIFGWDFPDKTRDGSSNGKPLYASSQLAALWPYGRAWIGRLTFESSAYIARYVMKKYTSKSTGDDERVNPTTGEVFPNQLKEFVRMSNRPGIGAHWARKFQNDWIDGCMVVNGIPMAVPKYFYRDLINRAGEDSPHVIGFKHAKRKWLLEKGQLSEEELARKAEYLQVRASQLKRTLVE